MLGYGRYCFAGRDSKGITICFEKGQVSFLHKDCLNHGSNDQIKQDVAKQHHPLRKQVQIVQVSCHLPPPFMAVRHRPCLLALKKKDPRFRNQVPAEILRIFCFGHKTDDLVRSKINSLWAYRNLFCQLSGDGNSHGSGMSQAIKTSPKLSFTAPGGLGNAVVGRGSAGWTTSKSGHPCPCQSCSLLHKRLEDDIS